MRAGGFGSTTTGESAGSAVIPRAKPRALYGRRKAEQREGKYFEKPKIVPFRDMALEYLKTVEGRRRRKWGDQSRINRWLTAFGDQDANTVTIRQIEKVLTDLGNEGMYQPRSFAISRS